MQAGDYCSGLEEKLEEINIKRGDMLYIASDIRNFIYDVMSTYGAEHLDAALDRLTDVLKDRVGKEGTILFPVFSWDFCRGNGFDHHNTQGEVGTYSNWVLNRRSDFRRTRHPIYSFMVWGKKADLFCGMANQDAWGAASPFYYLMRNGGKQLEFDVEAFHGLTFIHCIEQWVGVPYRHPKYFFGNYTDENGDTEFRCYSMYVRDRNVYEHTKTTHQYLEDNGAALGSVWRNNKLTVVDIAKCKDVVSEDIIHNDGKNNLFFKDYDFHYGGRQTVPYEVGNLPETERRDTRRDEDV